MTERILRALAREVVGEVRARRRRVVAARVALIVTNNLFYPLLPPSSTILVVEAFLGDQAFARHGRRFLATFRGRSFVFIPILYDVSFDVVPQFAREFIIDLSRRGESL